MANEVEYLLMCLFPIYIPALVKYMSVPFVHSNWMVVFLLLSLGCSLYIINVILNWISGLQIFSWSVAYSFS